MRDCTEKHLMELTKEAIFLSCSTGDPGDFIGFDDLRGAVRLGSSAL